MVSFATFELCPLLLGMEGPSTERYDRLRQELWVHLLGRWPRREGSGSPHSPIHAAEWVEDRRTSLLREGYHWPLMGQIQKASELTGRWARPEEYLRAFDRLVQVVPFGRNQKMDPVLGGLKAQGVRIGAVSWGHAEPATLLRRLAHDCGLDRYVEIYALGPDEGVEVPLRDLLRALAETFSQEPRRAVYVGSQDIGILEARKVGFGRVISTRASDLPQSGFGRSSPRAREDSPLLPGHSSPPPYVNLLSAILGEPGPAGHPSSDHDGHS